MKVLGRYLFFAVFYSTLLVLLLLIGLDYIFGVLDEVGSLNETYKLKHAAAYLLIRMPERIDTFLPVSVLIGLLIGLGSLASTSQLTVMRASGVSIPRILFHSAKPAALLIFAVMIFNELFLGYFVQRSETYRWEKVNDFSTLGFRTAWDVWLKEDQFFYRVNLARDDGVLLGLSIYELDQDHAELVNYYSSPLAKIQDGQWYLQSVRKVSFDDEKIMESRSEEMILDLPIEQRYIELQSRSPSDIAPISLFNYASYLDEKGQSSGFYWLAFWQKALMPLTVFAVLLLGASFVFGSLRNAPAGTRVFLGIVIGLSVKFAQDLLGPSALLWGFTPALAVLIPAAFCTVWALWQIHRAG